MFSPSVRGVLPCRTCHHHSLKAAHDFCALHDAQCKRPQTGCNEHTPPIGQGPDMRVLVCGPLDYSDRERFAYALDKAWRRRRIAQVVHWGGQVGRLAEGWCATRGIGVRDLGVTERRFSPSVEQENSYVLETGTPQGVIVFPGESHRVQVLMQQLSGSDLPIWHPYGQSGLGER